MAPSFPKKITTKTCGLSQDVLNDIALGVKGGGIAPVLRVVGRTNGIEQDSSQFGEWTKFVGEHYAMNLIDGSDYKSRKAMFPDAGSDILLAELSGAQADDPKATVEYAMEIGVRYNEPKANGQNCYAFEITPLIEGNTEDPLKALMNSLPKPALPKPGKGKDKK